MSEMQVPFNEAGDQLSYPEWGGKTRANFEFEDTLVFDGFERGCSAARLLFRRSDGTRVRMFMKEFSSIVPLLRKGKLKGTFTFCKRGQNYACKMMPKDATL